MTALTERQQEIYNWIVAYIEHHATQPSYRQIGAHFQIAPQNVLTHLRAMEDKKILKLSFQPGGSGFIQFAGVRFRAEAVTTAAGGS